MKEADEMEAKRRLKSELSIKVFVNQDEVAIQEDMGEVLMDQNDYVEEQNFAEQVKEPLEENKEEAELYAKFEAEKVELQTRLEADIERLKTEKAELQTSLQAEKDENQR